MIDLNFDLSICSATSPEWRRHEQRTIALRAIDRSPAESRVPEVRPALSRESSRATVLLLGPVSLHGVCAADLSRESARYRRVPALAGSSALSPRDSRHGLAQ